jgi:hypothetical protein
MLLCLRQGRDAGVWARVEATERCYVHWIEFGIDSRGASQVVFEVEDTAAEPGLLALADFTFAVKVPDWFAESADDLGVGPLQDVVHVVGRDDVRLPARERLGDTEEANEVGAVRVEELPCGSLAVGCFFCVLFRFRWVPCGRLFEADG